MLDIWINENKFYLKNDKNSIVFSNNDERKLETRFVVGSFTSLHLLFARVGENDNYDPPSAWGTSNFP